MRACFKAIPTTLAALLLTTGCGEVFDPASLLQSYRVVSIDAPAVVTPGDTVTARAVAYEPPSTQRAPSVWRVCPYSLGAQVQYACLAPESELNFEGDVLSVDLATAQFGDYTGLAAALEPAAAALEVQAQRFGLGSVSAEMLLQIGVDLVITLESGPADARVRSVRMVHVAVDQAQRCAATQQLQTICASGQAPEALPCSGIEYQVTAACESEANANPTLEAFEVVELADGAAQAGDVLTLRVTPGADARQPFYYDDPRARCPSDGGAEVLGGPCTEELYYRWYTSLGSLKQAITYESERITDRETVLTLPADATGEVTVFVVAYDGRGGVTALEQTFEIDPGT